MSPRARRSAHPGVRPLPLALSAARAEPVDIILLAYNRLDYLIEMVDALAAHTAWPYRLTIVDNVSGPETRNWLRAHRDRFHQVIFNDRNEHLAGYQRGHRAHLERPVRRL